MQGASPIHPLLRRPLLAISILLGSGAGGCANIRVTDPPRTATEQFLLSTAAAEAVAQLNVEALRGRSAYVDTRFFAPPDEEFVLGELRSKLLLGGVRLVNAYDDAEVIIEVRSGGVGIDKEDLLVGLPSLVVETEEGGSSLGVPFRTPEVALLKNITQMGVAAVAFVAYWRETGEVVSSSGPFIGRSLRDDWWFFGFGPNTVGDIPTAEEHGDERE